MEQPLPAERHRRIHELLGEERVVRVSALSEQLGVSEVTIRRDLEVLERRGMLERTHGGRSPPSGCGRAGLPGSRVDEPLESA